MEQPQYTERERRWRLILGQDAAGESSAAESGLPPPDAAIDAALSMLYNEPERRKTQKDSARVGHGPSMPSVARWLEDIRSYFPEPVVQVMQKDALERLGLTRMLLDPGLLDAVQPDVNMAATLISLGRIVPQSARESARRVVRKVVDELVAKLANPMRQSVAGALHRSVRNRRPRHNEIDWNRTIRANLRNYQAELKTIVVNRPVGYARRRSALRKIILCIDQSGSMASSLVYAGIFGAVLASIPAIQTHVVVYDTAVVDLTHQASDPVELLFGTQLGGGNDTSRALDYCANLTEHPPETILLLITDLYEGDLSAGMLRRLKMLVAAGVQVIVLLALSDDGAPAYDHDNATEIAAMGVPVFACTPDQFPHLMGAAISRENISEWAGRNGLVVARGRT